MAEGVKSADGAVAESEPRAAGGKPPEPDPDPERAPRGWRWDSGQRRWVPRLSPGRKKKAARDPGTEPASEPGDAPRDPAPGWMREDSPRMVQANLPFDEVPQEVKDDIAGLAGLIGVPLLAMLEQIDPYCGQALRYSYEPVIDAALPLICRSSKIVAYFAEDKADWLLWGKLALALKPVGQAILEHHVFRTVEVVRDKDGRRVARPRAGRQQGDQLQPPAQPEQQPQFQYAA